MGTKERKRKRERERECVNFHHLSPVSTILLSFHLQNKVSIVNIICDIYVELFTFNEMKRELKRYGKVP